ncbi:hypothetical protein HDC90_004306 [Pedobacter sp. AK013]|nr:hypothetical protein [Pedobacter sp. AK013]
MSFDGQFFQRYAGDNLLMIKKERVALFGATLLKNGLESD